MHKNYITDEKVLHDIIKKSVKCVDIEKKIRMNIYYKKIKNILHDH